MSEFTLSRESIEELLDYDVIICGDGQGFENGSEERRLKNTAAIIGFRIKTPALTKTQMQTYRSFLISKYGSLTSFTFTSPFDDTEYNVRFVPGSFTTTYAGGFFQCSFDFKRV